MKETKDFEFVTTGGVVPMVGDIVDDENGKKWIVVRRTIHSYTSMTIHTMKSANPTPNAETPVTIHYDEDGAPVGVAVQTVDERFEIALKDIDNGREMTWDDAMKFELPTKKQATIICAYLDDINAKLKEAGGEPLDKWYWTSSEYSANYAWFYYGYGGRLGDNIKSSTYSVRPVLAF